VESLTFYFDRCFGRDLPKALRILNPPFNVEDHWSQGFADEEADDEWLHKIGPKKWIVCSHDRKWQRESLAVEAIIQHKIGCFYLYGANSKHFFKVGSLAYNYHKVAKVLGRERRPFIYSIDKRNRLRKLL
jgi:hypothetical protein